MKPISLTAYAKLRGVSAMAVSRAVKSGRLSKSVTRDDRGQPKIKDPALADREWEATTDLSRAPGYVRERAEARAPPRQEELEEPDEEVGSLDIASLPSARAGMSLSEATTLEKVWKAKHAELKFRKEAGDLIPKGQVRRTLETTFAACKTKLLAVPSRARQALPHLTAADIAIIEGLVREALEGLSDGAA